MRLKNHNYFRLRLQFFIGLAFSAMVTGCSESNEPISSEAADEIAVSFRLAAGAAGISRAVDDFGTPAESHIDLDNLKILVFDRSETLSDILYDNGEMAPSTSLIPTGDGEYVLRTSLDPQRYDLSSEFAIVTLANWQTKPGNAGLQTDLKGHALDRTEIGTLTISDLRNMDFTLNSNNGDSQPISWRPGDGSWIPMFGSRYVTLKGYDKSRFGEANPMPLPDVNLVRAVTKIEIINRDVMNGPDIASIELSHRNQKGWLMQDFTFNGATSNVSLPTLRDNAQYTDKRLTFHRDGETFTAYIPEMELENAGSRRAICVNLNMNGVANQKWIYLAPYASNGNPILEGSFSSDWDSIKRNYFYQYTINSLAFEFRIDVDPWKWGDKVHIELE